MDQSSFDAEHPFGFDAFRNEVIEGLKFPFKLYGVLPFKILMHSADEMDANIGNIHVTEKDLKQLSSVMTSLNEKWNAQITYCLFHTTQFPGDMILNFRGPHAPANLDPDNRY
jgi:hypothetical protein